MQNLLTSVKWTAGLSQWKRTRMNDFLGQERKEEQMQHQVMMRMRVKDVEGTGEQDG